MVDADLISQHTSTGHVEAPHQIMESTDGYMPKHATI